MTRDEMVESILFHLGYRTGDTVTAAQIVRELPIVQLMLEQSAPKPWFLVTEMASVLTEPGEQRIPTPGDFLEEVDEEGLSIYCAEEEDYVALVKNDFDILQGLFKATRGRPEGYALVGNYFRLWPTPDAAYTLRMLYYGKAAQLSSGNAVNGFTENLPDYLMGAVGMRIATGLRDAKAVEYFTKIYSAAKVEVLRQHEARSHANADYQVGGRH